VSFHNLLLKNMATAVTLRMVNNNRRSSPAINAHLPKEKTFGKYSSDCREFEIMAVIWL
jgi:hypothetical protein